MLAEPLSSSPGLSLKPYALQRMVQASRLQGPPFSKAKAAKSLGHSGIEQAWGLDSCPSRDQTLTVEATSLDRGLLPGLSRP